MVNEEMELNKQPEQAQEPVGMLELEVTDNAAAMPTEEGNTDDAQAQLTQQGDTLPGDSSPDDALSAPTDDVADPLAPLSDDMTPATDPVPDPSVDSLTDSGEASSGVDTSDDAPVVDSSVEEAPVPATVEQSVETTAEAPADATHVADGETGLVAETPVAEFATTPEPIAELAEPVAEVVTDDSDATDAVAETPVTDLTTATPEAVAETVEPVEEMGGEETVPTTETEAPAADTDESDAIATEMMAMAAAGTGETPEAAQFADEPEEEASAEPAVDYSQFTKVDFVTLLDGRLTALKDLTTVKPGDFKRADEMLKQSKQAFDKMKKAERQAALLEYTAENGSEEGFEYTFDDLVERYEDLYKQIKSQKNTYFQTLDRMKDDNFVAKTELLRQLRELVEHDETKPVDPKVSWNTFKKIQDDWKAAGNISSPHNTTLWATYHALVDRYYNNRNIYFELLDMDRKRNSSLKIEVIERVENLANNLGEKPVTRQLIDEANAMFDEYKQIGPAPKTEQEVLWQRMKAALDTLYDKRRGQVEGQRKESAGVYEEKSAIYEELVPHTSFASTSINEWNDKSKEVMGIQERWNAIKGSMPREEGKELSRKFWAALKTFFNNKGEFFRELEGKREENLRLKVELCEQVEAILTAGDESSDATNRVIELQREWKNVGQVPEKQKNTIFERFKEACDAFFNKKRNRSQETDREFEENLAKKITLIERIEAGATESPDLDLLNHFKEEWNAIGYVPKKDMQTTQKRYVAAVNALVGSIGGLSAMDKEKAVLDAESGFGRGGSRDGGFRGGPREGGNDRGPRQDGGQRGGSNDRGPRGGGGGRDSGPRGGGDRGGNRDRPRRDRDDDSGYRGGNYSTAGGGFGGGDNAKYGDLRRRITALENDISTYNNNIEFFARSKNADKIRAEIDQKIGLAQKQLDDLRQQLKDAQSAEQA
jgi:hypothetical protein